MLYCFLDTNIFEEFQPIEQIKWLSELRATSVCLVVTSVVVGELDKHKSGNSNRLRKRARRSITFLKGLDRQSDNLICENVTLRFDLSEPKRDTLDAQNLSANVNDDLLIAKAVEFSNRHKTDHVAIVTDDTVVQFKAEGFGLTVPVLSEEYRLPHEVDPLVKENRELRNELLRRQNRQPKLSLGFPGSDGKIQRDLQTEIRFKENLISGDELTQAIEKKRKELEYPRKHQSLTARVYAVDYDILGATQREVDADHEEVREFLAGAYRSYLYQNSLHKVFLTSAIRIPLILENRGSAPARGIEVTLRTFYARKVLSGKPDLFECPAPPRQSTQRWAHERFLYSPPDYRSNSISEPGTDSYLWAIEESVDSSAYIANCYIDQLTHHKANELDELFVIIDRPAKFPARIEISYEIIAENVIDKISGHLTVIVNEVPSCHPSTTPASST